MVMVRGRTKTKEYEERIGVRPSGQCVERGV